MFQISSSKSGYILPLFLYGKKKHEICSKATKTCKLIKKFKDSSSCKKCISKFVLLKPSGKHGTYVGPTNTRLRALLPLRVEGSAGVTVGGQKSSFQTGKLVVLDDSFENSFWSESEEDVLLLSVDFHHPDLSDREKKSDSFTEFVQNKFITH